MFLILICFVFEDVFCYSLWDVNKDVLSAVGGSQEAVTLWPGEVLTDAFKHRTWLSAYRTAAKDKKTTVISFNHTQYDWELLLFQ